MNRSIIITWLSLCLLAAEAFTVVNHRHYTSQKLSTASGVQKTAFLGHSCELRQRHNVKDNGRSSLSSLKMDLEEPYSATGTKQSFLKRYKVALPQMMKTQLDVPKPSSSSAAAAAPVSSNNNCPIEELLKQHGMPWKSSIDPTYRNPVVNPQNDNENSQELFYMPFFEWQLEFMKDNLTNLRVVPTESKSGDDLTYIENQERGVRMITLCFASDEYRKIRMTIYDAGNRTQVFTSLWYPREDYNLPVLGTDLLQFAGGDRHLCVVDLQPILEGGAAEQTAGTGSTEQQQQQQSYEHLLKPIRDQYPSLQGQMTQRFYDSNRYFSNQMLYSRFEELQEKQKEQATATAAPQSLKEHPAYRDLFPAYQQYVQTHLNLIRSTTPNPTVTPQVLAGQAAYDTYSADRDPAHAMFAKVFGQEFADAFVYDVLFSYSEGQER